MKGHFGEILDHLSDVLGGFEWSKMTYNHVIYLWEVFQGHLGHFGSYMYTFWVIHVYGAILSHYGDFEPF